MTNDDRQSFTMFQGEDLRIEVLVTDPDTGTPVDMSAFPALLYRVSRTADQTATFSKTLGSGITVEDGNGTGDKAVIQLDSADTAALDPYTYYHELRLTDTQNYQDVVMYGNLVLRRSNSV